MQETNQVKNKPYKPMGAMRLFLGSGRLQTERRRKPQLKGDIEKLVH